ncbi:MAG: type IV toxin-antitoxin system AbiEi family antitoxin domain-containing protein [Luteolibacter sp.]
MSASGTGRIIQLADRKVVRPRDLRNVAAPREKISQLFEKGELHRVGRGLYISGNYPVSENHSLVLAAKRYPKGVVCLLSAAQFHGITLEMPSAVWMAFERGKNVPGPGDLPIQPVKLSETPYHYGIGIHRLEGEEIRIYSVAKTVADCFKFRNRIGISTAVEILRSAWSGRKVTADELWDAAKICRMLHVMRPYFDTLA